MSNYFTMYYYKIVGVAVLAILLSLLLPTILIVGVAVLAFACALAITSTPTV